MTTREELDARLAEFDRRRADADARTEAVFAGWAEDAGQAPDAEGPDGQRVRSADRLSRWRSRSA